MEHYDLKNVNFLDIEHAKTAEVAQKSLRESEERFKAFTKHSPDKIHIKDTDGRFLMINPQCERLFGMTNKEARGKTSLDIPNTMYADDFMAHDRAVIEAGQAITREETFFLQGVERTYLTIKFPIRDAAGDIVAVGASGTDITERTVIEEELRKARDELEQRIVERTQALTEEIQERRTIEAELLDRTELQQLLYAVTVIANGTNDTDAAMAACLKEICDYTTWPVGHIYVASPSDPDKLIPTDIWYLEDPEWFSFFHDITMKTVFEKGIGLPGRVLLSGKSEWIEDVTKDENFPRAKQGENIDIKAGFGFPIKLNNKVVAVMEFFSPFDQNADQSLMQSIELIGTQLGRLYERAETERALLEAKEKADSANKAKSTFLSSMSHELRTPMNAILGFAQMLEFNPTEPLTKAQKGSVGHIMEGGQHLLELINEILDLAKVEAGMVELSIEDISVRTTLDECLSLIHTMAEDRGIEIAVGEGFNTTAEIRTDHMRFKQSLLNLMSNAVKYNRPDGKITLDCHETPGGMLHITVADTGAGIPEDILGELFEPFSRLGAENTKVEGTGIGLTITKQLVESMDGHIGVDSEVGKGSTFWIELPLAERKLIDEVGAGAHEEDAGTKLLPDIDGTLLYVEDNLANLELMESIIEHIEGLSMISAHNAELGIELAKGKKPDLVILDINLPGMDGFGALKKLQRLKKTKSIPVIALSANAMPKDIEKGIEAGFKQYLTKPMKVEEVANTIKDILQS